MAYDDRTGKPVPEGQKALGYLTVGVGRNLDADPLNAEERASVGHDARTLPITHANAIMLLHNDEQEVFADLDEFIPWWADYDEVRSRVMADLCFNLGPTKLMTFKNFLWNMQNQRFVIAADCLRLSRWYNQVGTRGVRLVQMVQSGEDYTS